MAEEAKKKTTDAVVQKPKLDLSTLGGFTQTLENYGKSISQLLHTKYGISAQEFHMSCVNAVKANPKLLKCDPRSLFGAILLSAEVGLRPNTSDQHAFIIPYGNQAKFQIGYKGLVEMMYRNPRVLSIYAEAVYEKDHFDYGYGLNPFLDHKPHRTSDRGALQCVYAVCKLKDAEPVFTVVEKFELDAIKDISSSGNNKDSAYNNGTDIFNYMEIKAGIKKLSKLIPKASVLEISKAIEYDSKFQGGASVQAVIPKSPNDIVEATIVDSTSAPAMNSAFDEVEAETVPVQEIVPEPVPQQVEEPVQEAPPEKEEPNDLDFSTVGDSQQSEEPPVEEPLVEEVQEGQEEVQPPLDDSNPSDNGKLF